VKELRNHRSERAAGHDDGAFRTKRSARPDGNCRRERFEERDLGFHAAAVNQYRFNGLRNPVTTDSFGTVPRHDSDDQRAADRNEEAVPTQMISDRRNHRGAPPAKIK